MKRFLILLLLAAAPWGAGGASFNVNPIADAFVTAGPTGNLSGNNYGAAGALSLGAAGLPQGELQSVLQFNLSGAASSFNSTFGVGQWSIQSVTLQLSAAAANNSLFNPPAVGLIGISWMQNDSWQEGSGTPNTPGASGVTFASLQSTVIGANDESLGTFNFNGATSGRLNYTFELQPDFLADVMAGDNLSLRLFGADSSVSAVFNSRSFGTEANRPLLTVVAVPEPSTVALGTVGVLGIVAVGFARKRK